MHYSFMKSVFEMLFQCYVPYPILEISTTPFYQEVWVKWEINRHLLKIKL
jgi:hypothetical protein